MSFYAWFGIAVVVLATGLIWLFWKLFAVQAPAPASPEWVAALSPSRYAPMKRLLLEDDFLYLRTMPGVTPAVAARLRSERVQLFRSYFKRLKKDFARLESTAKAMLVSGAATPELSNALFEQRLRFTRSCFSVELHLALYRAGVTGVDVRGLLGALEGLRGAMQAPVSVGAAA